LEESTEVHVTAADVSDLMWLSREFGVDSLAQRCASFSVSDPTSSIGESYDRKFETIRHRIDSDERRGLELVSDVDELAARNDDSAQDIAELKGAIKKHGDRL
jgi:hypothetical protein